MAHEKLIAMLICSSNTTAYTRALLAMVALLGVISCGGSDSKSCSGQAKCGGDITGTWKVSSFCFNFMSNSTMDDFCPAATPDATGVKVSGTETYSSSLTLSSQLAFSGSVSYSLPSSCLTSNGVTVSCDVLQAALSPDLASEGVFSSVSCKKSGSGCSCVFVLAQQTGGSTGTYTTTAAGDYTETNSDGDVTSGTYCVSGNTLTEHVVDTGFSGTLILTKS